MLRRKSAALTAALAIACVLLASCTSGSGVNTETLDPTTSAATASSAAAASPSESSASDSSAPQSSAVASPSPTAGTDSGLPAGEAADRAAVESQWIKSWDVYLAIARTPAADREALAATVTVDPTKANMLDATPPSSTARACRPTAPWVTGSPGRSPSTAPPPPSSTIARIEAKPVSMKTATGDKVTVGVPRDHYQGNLVKGDDGVWRVAEVYYLKDEPC